MAHIIDITNDEEQVASAKATSKQVGITFTRAFWLCIFFCGIAVVLFFWGQIKSLSVSLPIDSGIFGTFGDFVGGFLGTIISLYSVYMLVRTFQNQIETNADVIHTNKSVIAANESVIETNKKILSQTVLQIFDSRFTTLLDLYHNALDSYSCANLRGRAAFETIVSDFQKKGLNNKTEYKRRSIGAVSEYINLYLKNRLCFSVHFRMLYLLARLTAEEKINENYRVSYAKSIRGQLSEGELLILRYNCLSQYGERMRVFVNKFNLIKHLPIMNLLEFTNWRNKLSQEGCCGAIDQLYIALKKRLTIMIDNDCGSNQSYRISSRIEFNMTLNDAMDTFDILFCFSKERHNGGAIKRPLEEPAFDSIPLDGIKDFLAEMFIEMFVYSNFFKFNGDDHHIVTSDIAENNDKLIKIHVRISRPGKRLALADRQVLPS